MITVGKLRMMLEKYDPEDLVIMSSDEEGNRYLPLYQIEENAVFNTRDDEYAGIRVLTKELEDAGFSEEDIAEKKSYNKNAIILYPE